MNPKLSIIVPVYNAEKYLHQCVDSILEQELTDLEVILVDDGSIDISAAICDEYVSRDSRVKVIHKTNGGVCLARNTGIESSSGEYITFVDADDWIESNMYREMITVIAGHQADIGICSFTFFDGRNYRDDILPWENFTVFEKKEIREKLIPALVSPMDLEGNKQPVLMGSVCRCIFKGELIRSNQIFFNLKIKFTEDVLFDIQAFSLAESIIICRQPYYNYRQDTRFKSSTTQRYMVGAYQIYKSCKQEIENIISGIGYDQRMQKQMQWSSCIQVLTAIRNLCAPGTPHSLGERVKQARYYIMDSDFEQNVDKLGYFYFRWDHKILVWLLRHSFIRTVIAAYTIRHRFW